MSASGANSASLGEEKNPFDFGDGLGVVEGTVASGDFERGFRAGQARTGWRDEQIARSGDEMGFGTFNDGQAVEDFHRAPFWSERDDAGDLALDERLIGGLEHAGVLLLNLAEEVLELSSGATNRWPRRPTHEFAQLLPRKGTEQKMMRST